MNERCKFWETCSLYESEQCTNYHGYCECGDFDDEVEEE